MTTARNVSIVLAATLALLGVACRSGSPQPVACPSRVSTTTVTLVDDAFTPACVAAATGATLTVSDTGSTPHTFTVTGTAIDVPVGVGETKQIALSGLGAGTYEVMCRFHPNMRGSLKVG